MSYKVLLPQPILPDGDDFLLKHGFEIVRGRGFTEEDIIADIADCDAMIVRTAKITARILDAAKKLRIIARHGAGYDGVDLSVAELAVFYMLYCSRRFKAVMNHCMEDYRYAKMGIRKTELEGKTLGLIGTGNIGRLVAKKAHFGFDMEVLAYDPFAREVPDYIRLVDDRDEIFRAGDYVSLHVPATKETIHSVGEHEFSLMKKTAFLINTARGSVIDEPALIRALQENKIAGAGLDVLEKEPFDPEHPLLHMEHVLVAPHIGGATLEASTRSSVACAKAIDDFFSGRTPEFIVPELRELL